MGGWIAQSMNMPRAMKTLLLIGSAACSPGSPIVVADLKSEARIVASFTGPEPLQTNWIVVPDGRQRIVVAHRSHLTILDTLGNVTARFGREGAGPGEFLSVPYLGTIGDSVWTIDRSLGRQTEIHSGDMGYRMDRLSFNSGKPRNAPVTWVGMAGIVSDGRYLVSASRPPPAGSPAGLVELLARASRPDSLEQILLSDPMNIDCFVTNGGRPAQVYACQRMFHLVAPDGRSATAVIRERDVAGGVALRLTRVAFTGDTLMGAVVAFPARVITESLRDSLIAGASRIWGFPLDGSDFKAPLHYGPVFYGHQGNDGSLWLAASLPPDLQPRPINLRQWYLVDPDGTLAGGFRLDSELTLGAVTRDAAWAIRDLDDGSAELVRITVTR